MVKLTFQHSSADGILNEPEPVSLQTRATPDSVSSITDLSSLMLDDSDIIIVD